MRRNARLASVDVYPWLKALHVLLAIVAVGTNATYGVWLARAARSPEHLGHVLRGVKFLDDRVANPSYVALGLVGILLILTGPHRFEDLWVASSLALYVALVGIGVGLYTPTLRRQIAIYEADGAGAAEFGSLTRRGALLGAALALVAVTIVFLMVVKPGV